MKPLFSVLLLAVTASLFAQELSGALETTVNYTTGAGEARTHSWGIEGYANVRLRVRAGEKASFFAAFNLFAMSGNYVEAAANMSQNTPFASTPLIYGQNFAAALELERLGHLKAHLDSH